MTVLKEAVPSNKQKTNKLVEKDPERTFGKKLGDSFVARSITSGAFLEDSIFTIVFSYSTK